MFAVTEQRFARRVAQRCTMCVRHIDEEDYTRTFIYDGFSSFIFECKDCRPLWR